MQSKKILISTLHFYNNFGSVLQAYALKTVLKKIGYEADIMDYQPHICDYNYFADPVLQELYNQKKAKFDAFRNDVLGISRNITAIADYDAYITGSDIVWGKEFSALDKAYFLEHAPECKPRIAYAASTILDSEGNTEQNVLFDELLPRFKAIGMRETSSVSCMQRFAKNVLVTDVLDPTLLLDETDYQSLEIVTDLTTELDGRPYLLSYFLTHDPAVVDYTNMLATKLGLRVIHYFADYPQRVFPKDADCFAFAGPGEFLSLVKNASCIFTNSFHGTCFSMIYRKPFYTYMAKRNMLSRVRDTVERLNMTDRYFTDFSDFNRVTLDIDYSQMEKMLNLNRDKSLSFLMDNLA